MQYTSVRWHLHSKGKTMREMPFPQGLLLALPSVLWAWLIPANTAGDDERHNAEKDHAVWQYDDMYTHIPVVSKKYNCQLRDDDKDKEWWWWFMMVMMIMVMETVMRMAIMTWTIYNTWTSDIICAKCVSNIKLQAQLFWNCHKLIQTAQASWTHAAVFGIALWGHHQSKAVARRPAASVQVIYLWKTTVSI